jgi:hypothetical protein
MVGIAVMMVCGLAEAFLVYAFIQFVRERKRARRQPLARTISIERGRARRGVLLADEMERRVAASQEAPRLIRMGPMRAGSRGSR